MGGLHGRGRGGGEDQPVWMLSCVSCGRVWGSLMSGCARYCGLTSRLTHLLSSTSWMLHLEWWANKGTISILMFTSKLAGWTLLVLSVGKFTLAVRSLPHWLACLARNYWIRLKQIRMDKKVRIITYSHRPSLIIVKPTTNQPKGSRL